MQDIQYNQSYNSMDSQLGLTSHFAATEAAYNSSPPPAIQQIPNINIPPINTKRARNSNISGSNRKRTKVDSNGNRNIPSKSVPISLVKREDDIMNQKKKGATLNQDSEPEFTDISNMKSDRSYADEESIEKQTDSRNNSLVDNCIDQGELVYIFFLYWINRVACSFLIISQTIHICYDDMIHCLLIFLESQLISDINKSVQFHSRKNIIYYSKWIWNFKDLLKLF